MSHSTARRHARTHRPIVLAVLAILPAAMLAGHVIEGAGGSWTIVGWNNLGMHCMDADYSVFSILPPYNTIHAQIIDPQGLLVVNPAGITVTYEAWPDPSGAINTTSINKTLFWQYVQPLYGASPQPDTGLAGKPMPGIANTPQVMDWDAGAKWFIAEGIPITPYDDGTMRHNPYPMFRLTARDSAGNVLATTDIVVPVSDEMDCRACHASGAVAAAMPQGGWANHADPQIDYRLNILLLHDDRQSGLTAFQDALAAMHYDATGLYATATAGQQPILCAGCHGSNALPGTGIAGIEKLTLAVHGAHATVIDPDSGLALGNSSNRSACYRCHPGAATRCLRGVMGRAVAADGTLEMQCQSCHGTMSAVGGINRVGWLDEPSCQNCHTGTATSNNGQIRYTSAIDASNQRRVAVNDTFATNPDVPMAGFSLYRFSFGHGGLACEACHGSTHAEYPSTHDDDNAQSRQLQGHAGPLADCGACHAPVPQTVDGGPHGMHPIGQDWVGTHGDVAENAGTGRCQVCHASDYTGSVLSLSLGDKSVTSGFGTRVLWQGFRVSCYLCHNGPGSGSKSANHAPLASNATLAAFSGSPSSVVLKATDADGNPLTYRIVSQPSHGTAGITGSIATLYPDAGYEGADSFTFAAWDGKSDSNLATVSAAVGANTCTLTCATTVPAAAPEGATVPFSAAVTAAGCLAAPAAVWTFGDGQSAAQQSATHVYPRSGSYGWTFSVSADASACSASGTIAVQGLPPTVTLVKRSSNHFQITILGSNFHTTVQVWIGGRQWTKTNRVNDGKLLLGGRSALKALFPANTWVTIRLVNPDDNFETSVQYNRSTNQWRPAI